MNMYHSPLYAELEVQVLLSMYSLKVIVLKRSTLFFKSQVSFCYVCYVYNKKAFDDK